MKRGMLTVSTLCQAQANSSAIVQELTATQYGAPVYSHTACSKSLVTWCGFI